MRAAIRARRVALGCKTICWHKARQVLVSRFMFFSALAPSLSVQVAGDKVSRESLCIPCAHLTVAGNNCYFFDFRSSRLKYPARCVQKYRENYVENSEICTCSARCSALSAFSSP
jgi:hypothetical protein